MLLNRSPARWRTLAFVLAALGALVVWAPVGAQAATTWTVNLKGDPGSGSCPAACSLRNAASAAKAGDTIVVPKGTYTISRGQIVLTVNVTISGAGAGQVTIDGGGRDRIFHVRKGASVSVSGVTLTNGFIDGNGGAALVDGTLTLTGSIVSASKALGDGAGIYSDGTLDVIASTITGNTGPEGAGLTNIGGTLNVLASAISGNTSRGAGGGGIFNQGSMTISASTISGNTAAGPGGGLDEQGTTADSIINSTIAGNVTSGSSGAQGGGIYDANSSSGLTGKFDTIVANSAPVAANVYFNDLGAGGLQNTIVADPLGRGNNCDNSVGEPTSLGHNLESDTNGAIAPPSCNFTATTDLKGVNPKLGKLANNGGPTETMALLSGSPAINHGTSVKGIATDQRGAHRPVGGAPDIGAYEYAGLIDMGLAGSAATPVRVGRNLVYTLTATNDGPLAEAAKQVVIVDQLPAGVHFVAASKSCVYTATLHGVACSIGSVGHGKSASVKIVARPTKVGSVIDKGSVFSGGTDPNPANDNRTLTVTVQDSPAAHTMAADSVLYRAATLHGSVTPNNAQTTYWFEYGRTTAYGSTTGPVTASGLTALSVLSKLQGLKPGKLYHYRLVAKNAWGVVHGHDLTFLTPYLPVVHVNPPRVRPGERIHVYGSVGECPAGSEVTVVSKAFSDAHTYQGQGAIYTTVRPGGRFSIHAQIPTSRKGGPYKISALCGRYP